MSSFTIFCHKIATISHYRIQNYKLCHELHCRNVLIGRVDYIEGLSILQDMIMQDMNTFKDETLVLPLKTDRVVLQGLLRRRRVTSSYEQQIQQIWCKHPAYQIIYFEVCWLTFVLLSSLD